MKKKDEVTGRRIKRVSRRIWNEQLPLLLGGKINQKAMAGKLGISSTTLITRFNQFFEPETYGELPEDFFIEDDVVKTAKQTLEELPPQEPKKIKLPDLTEFI